MVAAAALVGVASPALAEPQDPEVGIVSISNQTLRSGESAQVQYSVRNANDPADPEAANTAAKIRFELPGGVSCSGKCNFTQAIPHGATVPFPAALKAGNLAPGEEKTVDITIIAEISGRSGDETFQLTLQGPEQAPSVPSVSGKVENLFDATPVPNAAVFLQDSAGKEHLGSTDKNGNFKIVGKASNPIAPGIMGIVVQKDDWEQATQDATGEAGQALTGVVIKMRPKAGASSAPPTSAVPAEETADPGTTAEATDPLAGEPDDGGPAWWLIALGGLLVAVGIGAIVLMIVRKRNDEDDDQPDDDPTAMGPRGRPGGPPVRAGGPRPGQRRPAADPTAVMRRPEPVGARGGADATMITRSPLADRPRQPGAPGDNPTMVHGRMPADATDPYGTGARQAPAGPPPGGGYGGYGQSPAGPSGAGYDGGYGGYGAQPGGAPSAYPPPVSAPGYPAPSSPAGYPPPISPAGYPPPTSPAGYPSGDQGGYGQQGAGGYQTPSYGDSYGSQPPSRSGGHGQDSYGDAGYGGQSGGYGPGQHSGGQHSGGQHSGGYDPQATGGYDAYGSQPGGQGHDEYDQRQPRHGQRPNPPQAGDRRLDWLDD
jgi:hypothetical protein